MSKKSKTLLSILLLLAAFLLGFYLCLIVFYTADVTMYSPGYSDKAFSMIKIGMSSEQVHSILGDPIAIYNYNPINIWDYSDKIEVREQSYGGIEYHRERANIIEFDQEGRVSHVSGGITTRIKIGMSKNDVLGILGEPRIKITSFRTKFECYTKPSSIGLLKERAIQYNQKGKVLDLDKTQYDID